MLEIIEEGEKIKIDLSKIYRCSCSAGIYKAEKENGEKIYVHKTCNGYSDHSKQCPDKFKKI